jgi:RNA polymerase primary sigma factor
MPSFTRCLDRRSLDNFLNKASSIPRLTLEDEIRLSNQLRAGLKYLGHNPDAIPQTTEERKIRDRAKYARERIIAANIMLVVSIAYKYQEAADVEDLISEGTIGLSKAAEKFDAAKGCVFSTYAYWWIRQAISLHVKSCSTVRLSVYAYDMIIAVKRCREILKREGRKENYENIYELLKAGVVPTAKNRLLRLTVETLKELMELPTMRAMGSLDAVFDESDSSGLLDIVADDNSEPVSDLFAMGEIGDVIDGLKPLESDILCRRFGLNGYAPQTIKEIAQDKNMTRTKVQTASSKAMSQCRKIIIKRHPDLRDYLIN